MKGFLPPVFLSSTPGILLFVLASTCVRAQSPFQLFQPGVQYLYENENYVPLDQVFTTQFYGVRVDSLGCQDLYTSLAFDQESEQACIHKVPSPFGYAVCQGVDSTLMNFAELGQLVLYQGAATGSTWTALRNDSVTVRAVVEAVRQDSLFNISDSVKIIALIDGDGDTLSRISISRTYGLVEGTFFYDLLGDLPPLRLAGTSQDELGLQLPADEVYGRVQVGNEYHIDEVTPARQISPTDDALYDLHRQRTLTVTSVDSLADETVTFTTTGDLLTFAVRTDGSRPGRDSVLYRDTIMQWAYAYPDALRGLQPGARTVTDSLMDELEYRVRSLFRGACDQLSTRFTFEADFPSEADSCGYNDAALDGAAPGGVQAPFIPFSSDTLAIGMSPVQTFIRYLDVEGVPACGTPYDFSDIIIGVREFDAAFDAQFQVFPNPTSGQLNVVLPGTASYQVRLYNLAGSQVQSQWMRGGSQQSLFTETLPVGSYFLVVFEGGRVVGRRQVIATP
ncbi:T9SS type A sorting domain-containing protein [Neolewinella sp.]|uniref:T9SS type A sorting domain-containing protein n=1 Tax=Neolewinella sp. TaxID=2993543 RepID=UPI003B526CCF